MAKEKFKIGKEAQDVVIPEVHQDTPASVQAKPRNFEAWWALTQSKKNLNPMLKQSFKVFFENKGYMKSGDFDAGLKEFGF